MRTKTEYLVEWEDDSDNSWEPLSHVTAELVERCDNESESDCESDGDGDGESND